MAITTRKTSIVLDADVIIHFNKGGHFFTLLDIFPEYEYIILDVVYNELHKYSQTRQMVNNAEGWLKKKVSTHKFSPKGQSIRDYAILKSTKGTGESACMIYCRDNHHVLGSSNIKDIQDFCKLHGITYLTTLDFLYYAFVREKMTREECNNFIVTVKSKNSYLPKDVSDIATYFPNVTL